MISTEEFIEYAKRNISSHKLTKLINTVIIVIFAIMVISCSRTVYLIMLPVNIILTIGGVIYNMRLKKHCPHRRRINRAISNSLSAPYSLPHRNSLTEVLRTETDPLTRAFITDMLCLYNIVTGDAQAAYGCLLNDPALFAADPFFEVKYLNRLVNYYCEFGGTDPAALGYAEDAARRSEMIMKDYPRNDMEIFSLIEHEFDNGIMLAHRRGEWQQCYDLLSVRIDHYYIKLMKFKSMRVHCAIDRIFQADCLYHMGRYDEALRLCCENSAELASVPYQYEKSQRLTEILRQTDR